MKYPFNVRSFFTSRETSAIGGGIVLWRGYFQSVRPAIGRMLINVDISTAAMYKPGRAIDVALELLGMAQRGPLVLSPKHGFPERELIKLQRFLSGVRINVDIPGRPTTGRRPPRVIKKLTKAGANQLSFTMRDGKTITVAQYFEKTHNYRLQFPDIVCIEVRPTLRYGFVFATFNVMALGWVWCHHPNGVLYDSRRANHAETGPTGEDEGCPQLRHEEAPRATSDHSCRPGRSQLRAAGVRAGALIHFGPA